jgi:MFS family permease
MADKFGGSRVLGAGVALWSLCTILTPMAAGAGLFPLITMRIMMGLGEGPAFPAVHSMISGGVPPERRSTAGVCRVCARACMCVCVRVRACLCVCVCMLTYT